MRLSAAEISALRDAHEHVRVHRGHDHPWTVRDAATLGIGKVIAAARDAQES